MIAASNLEIPVRRDRPKPLVVCVDDEPRVLAALRRVLRQEPYETIATEDPERVLELVGQRPVSLVVADQRMPTMSGTHLLRTIRRESPATRGLILSGHAGVEEIASAIDDGTVGCFIRKPWDDADFRSAIRQLLCLEAPAPGKRPPPPRRSSGRRGLSSRSKVLLRVDCAGKESSDLMVVISEFLARPDHSLCGGAVVLENLALLGDSFSRFLTEVILALARSSAPVALVEESGVAKELLQLLGEDVPFVIFPLATDLPAPRRVLLVGGFASSRFLPRRIESAGHACRTAASVSQAIRQMILTSFDAVILGRLFTQERGVDLAKRVMERLLEAPVFAIPENATTEEILEVIRKSRRRSDND